MQQYFKDSAKCGAKKMVRVESYFARKDVIDEIYSYAHGTFKDGKKNYRRAIYVKRSKNPVMIFDDLTGHEVEMWFIDVVWRDDAYITGDTDSVWHKFGSYET